MKTDPNSNPVITLAIPTRNNMVGLRRCVTSAITNSGVRTRVVILFSGDDLAGYRYCPDWPFAKRFIGTERGFYYKDANDLFRTMQEAWTDTDIFVWTDDDSEFVLPGWGRIAVDTLFQRFPDGQGVLELFPGMMKHFISRVSFFNDNYEGKLYCDDFIHFFGDSARGEDIASAGRFAALDTSDPTKFLMEHSMMARTYPDMLDARRQFYERDKALYLKQRAERNEADSRT